MEKSKQPNKKFDVTIGLNDGHNRSIKKKASIEAAAKAHHLQRSPARLLKNEMLAILYTMEAYLSDENITLKNMKTIKDFANNFLEVLHLKKGEFAAYIEIDLSNLNKYYKEDRKFNPQLAIKFGYFFHTPADLWLKVQFKNEMLLFEKEIKSEKKYKKYDYEKVLKIA